MCLTWMFMLLLLVLFFSAKTKANRGNNKKKTPSKLPLSQHSQYSNSINITLRKYADTGSTFFLVSLVFFCVFLSLFLPFFFFEEEKNQITMAREKIWTTVYIHSARSHTDGLSIRWQGRQNSDGECWRSIDSSAFVLWLYCLNYQQKLDGWMDAIFLVLVEKFGTMGKGYSASVMGQGTRGKQTKFQ